VGVCVFVCVSLRKNACVCEREGEKDTTGNIVCVMAQGKKLSEVAKK
jgi:hypothetical protein